MLWQDLDLGLPRIRRTDFQSVFSEENDGLEARHTLSISTNKAVDENCCDWSETVKLRVPRIRRTDYQSVLW